MSMPKTLGEPICRPVMPPVRVELLRTRLSSTSGESDGGDGEVHAAGAQRWQPDEDAERDGDGDAEDGASVEADVVVDHEAAGDPGAAARQRELREGQPGPRTR